MDEKNKRILQALKTNLTLKEEVADEIMDFKDQVEKMETIVKQFEPLNQTNQLNQIRQNNQTQIPTQQITNTIAQKIDQFKKQVGNQQQQNQQTVQQSIQQIMIVLDQVTQQEKVYNELSQINQLIGQTQQKINQQLQQY